MTLVFALTGFVSLALADEAKIPLPFVGANVVLSDCTTQVVAAPWNSRRTGETLITNARAQAICFDAEGDLAVAEAQAKAIVKRAEAEVELIKSAGEAAKTGGSVSYDTRGADTHLATGPAADWREYGTALASSNGNYGTIGGMGIGYVDPQYAALYRLNAGHIGFAGNSGYLGNSGHHPMVPGATYPQLQVSPVDNSSALAKCQSVLAKTSDDLAKCDGD